MALALILRGAAKSNALRCSSRLPSIGLENTSSFHNVGNLSQFTTQNNKTNLLLVRTGDLVPKLHNIQIRNAHFDHGLLWAVEKVWATSLLAIIPLTVLSPNLVMDDIFVITTIIHNHWGFEACVVDYVRPVIFGNTIPKIAIIILYTFSAIVLGGLLYFNHNDIGIGRAIRKWWSIRDKN